MTGDKTIEGGDSCSEQLPQLTSVAVAGLGLIGGSLAQRLACRGMTIYGWDLSQDFYPQAVSSGIRCMPSLEDMIRADPDLLVIATPLKAIDDLLPRIKKEMNPQTTLTDVGSVKQQVLHSVEKAGLADSYVGAHPMAGNEQEGFYASSSDLMDNALWAITVADSTDYRRFLQVGQMITAYASNEFITVDAAIHDQAAALISHMPHAVSTALINRMVESPVANVAYSLSAGSWRDMTRVALTSPERTKAMIEENPQEVSSLLKTMADSLRDLSRALDQKDNRYLDQFFAFGNPYRQSQWEQRRLMNQFGQRTEPKHRTLTIDQSDWKNQLGSVSRNAQSVVSILSPSQMEIKQYPHL